MVGVLYAGLVTVGGTIGSGPWEQSEEARDRKHSSATGDGAWNDGALRASSTTSLLKAADK